MTAAATPYFANVTSLRSVFTILNSPMKLASSLAIAVGFITFSLAIYGQNRKLIIAYEAALGVFFAVIGLLGFTFLRIAKLEEELREMKKEEVKAPGDHVWCGFVTGKLIHRRIARQSVDEAKLVFICHMH
jgi:hypothetical protein